MKARDVLFIASLLVLAALAFSPGNASACEGEYAAGESCAVANEIVFQDYEVADPTCVCSADQGLPGIFSADQDTCTAT